MKEHKEIITKNSKGQYHGYQEVYRSISQNIIDIRCMCKNNLYIGYFEWHPSKETRFHIR